MVYVLHLGDDLYMFISFARAHAPFFTIIMIHQVPACYQHTAPRLTPAYFAKLVPDTLFYIFYGMPGDEAQVLAAEELTHRGWYFHKELKAWLTAVPNTEPSQKTDRCASSIANERGSVSVHPTFLRSLPLHAIY